MSHFHRDSKGMFHFTLASLFIPAMSIILFSLLSCRVSVGREHDRQGYGPRPDHISRIEGTWFFKAFIHPGRLELYWTRDGWHGRILFDSSGQWEELTNIFFDSRTGEVQFRRGNGNQQYSGTLSGDRMEGTFFTPGLGTYPWNAWREAGPYGPGPRPAHISKIEGMWFFKAFVHPGRFELYWTRNGWHGRILFDSSGQWEELTDIFFDSHTGEVQFRRVNGNQQYSGTLSGDRMEGTFFTPGIGTYPWNAWRQ